jgi:hypothetical protein
VVQPTKKGCAGATAAMVAGETFQDVVDFVGHDGMERPFAWKDIYSYLATKGIITNTGLSFSKPESSDALMLIESDPTEDIIIKVPKVVARALRNLAIMDAVTISEVVSGMMVVTASRRGMNMFEETPPPVIPEKRVFSEGIDGAYFSNLKKLTTSISFEDEAIITVLASLAPVKYHALYWDGSRIYDPAPDAKENPALKDYVITQWQTIRRLKTLEEPA